jgi:hypothetical protein
VVSSNNRKAPNNAPGKRVASPSRDEATLSAIPPAVFSFCGERQPQEFVDGVASAMAILRELGESSDIATDDLHGVSTEVINRIRRAADRAGRYAEAAIAALCSYTLTCIGEQPDLDRWVPLSSPWGGENSEIPPKDCMFFEVDGRPYSVEPNLHTMDWSVGAFGLKSHLDSIRDRAKAIGRARFETMRPKFAAARRAADARRQGSTS